MLGDVRGDGGEVAGRQKYSWSARVGLPPRPRLRLATSPFGVNDGGLVANCRGHYADCGIHRALPGCTARGLPARHRPCFASRRNSRAIYSRIVGVLSRGSNSRWPLTHQTLRTSQGLGDRRADVDALGASGSLAPSDCTFILRKTDSFLSGCREYFVRSYCISGWFCCSVTRRVRAGIARGLGACC